MTWVGITALVGSQAVAGVVLRLVHTCVPVKIRKGSNEVVGGRVHDRDDFVHGSDGVRCCGGLGTYRGRPRGDFSGGECLGGVSWTARQLPVEDGGPLERFTIDYAHVVIEQEWVLMAERQSSPAATQLGYQMREHSSAFNPDGRDGRQIVNSEKLTDHVAELASARRQWLNAIQDAVSGILWISLIGGAVANRVLHVLSGHEQQRRAPFHHPDAHCDDHTLTHFDRQSELPVRRHWSRVTERVRGAPQLAAATAVGQPCASPRLSSGLCPNK